MFEYTIYKRLRHVGWVAMVSYDTLEEAQRQIRWDAYPCSLAAASFKIVREDFPDNAYMEGHDIFFNNPNRK